MVRLPLLVAIKDFFGVYTLTPFEDKLLSRLIDTLEPADRIILYHQLDNFTTTRRLIKHVDDPKAYGFTNFHTVRCGKDISVHKQNLRFMRDEESEACLARACVVFMDGVIDVQFWIVRGVLFTIEYRSPQNIY